MDLFIAGCGRSGTTLALDLMHCFQDTYVLAEAPYYEAPPTRFRTLAHGAKHAVIKRTGECWQTLPALPLEIGLIYCVRHPFDVLTSTHPLSRHLRKYHITFERWTSEYEALARLRSAQPHRPIFFLRYEDLVADPNRVQAKMAQHFDLQPACLFTENPAGVQIFTRSVEKWQQSPELFAYLETIPRRFRSSIHRFSEEFGYSLPPDYIAAGLSGKSCSDLTLTHITNPNELELLGNQPFFWMGGGATILDLESPFTGTAKISFEAQPGPSHPESPERHLQVSSGLWRQTIEVQAGHVSFQFPVQAGANELHLEILETPTVPVLPSGDSRPLLLGVLNLKLEKT